jgi:tetratricopeptide (TPR) repeat protein
MPDPVCEALIFCELDIIEAKTSKHTLVGIFESLSGTSFPFKADPFFVHAIIANWVSPAHDASLVLNIKTPGIHSIIGSVGIPLAKAPQSSRNPRTISARFSFKHLIFPAAGTYEAELLLDEESIGSRPLEIRSKITTPKKTVVPPGSPQTIIDHVIADYTKAIKQGSPSWNTYHQRGDAYQAQNEFANAIADYNEAIRLNPSFWAPYHDRGNAYQSLREFEKALADYGEAIRLNPNAAHTYLARGKAYQAAGKLAEALADSNQAVRLLPANPQAYFVRALVHLSMKEADKAIEDYTEAIRLNPKDAGGYQVRGGIYLSIGKSDEALTDYQEAIRINPKSVSAYLGRARVYGIRKNIEMAMADYDEILRMDPQNAEASFLRAACCQLKGDWDRAISGFDDAIRQGFQKAEVFHFRAYSHKAKGNFLKAIPDYDEAIRLAPLNASLYFERGDAYRALAKWDQALTDFNEAIRINPKHAEAFYHRGLVYHLKGDYDHGMADYDEAIRLNPNYDHPRRMRQIALELRAGGARVAVPTEKEQTSEPSKPESGKVPTIQKTIASLKGSDPLIGLKMGAKELNNHLKTALKNGEEIHVETLLTALGSLAGFACQMGLREELIKTGAATEESTFVIVSGADGRRYFFGDPLNKPLAEDTYSVWSLTAEAAQKSGNPTLPDVNEIFQHVAATIGVDRFGIPRVPEANQVKELPLHWVKTPWPKMLPVIVPFCDKPTEWPIVFALAIQESIFTAKDLLDPALAATLVMECAIPMSKVDLPEFYELPFS